MGFYVHSLHTCLIRVSLGCSLAKRINTHNTVSRFGTSAEYTEELQTGVTFPKGLFPK